MPWCCFASAKPWNIYAEELGGLGYGYPMWFPDPSKRWERIQLGDIGYFEKGRFRLLFNCTRPRDDESHKKRHETLPDHFVHFDCSGEGDVEGPDVSINQSEIIRESSRNRHASPEIEGGPVALGVNHDRTLESEASLRLHPPARRTFLTRKADIEQYMARHCGIWVEFFANRKLTQKDIVFISGFTTTTVWDVSARRKRVYEDGLSLKGMGNCLAGLAAGISCGIKGSSSGNMFKNKGPEGRTFDADGNHEPDQCIFLDIVKTSTRDVLALRTRDLMQHLSVVPERHHLQQSKSESGSTPISPSTQPPPAAPLALTPPDSSSASPPAHLLTETLEDHDAPQGGLPRSSQRSLAVVESALEAAGLLLEGVSLSFVQKSVHMAVKIVGFLSKEDEVTRKMTEFHPIDDLLDYVLQNSHVDVAAASYEDLYPLCVDGRLPHDIVAEAMERKLPVVVVDGVSRIGLNISMPPRLNIMSARSEVSLVSSHAVNIERTPMTLAITTTYKDQVTLSEPRDVLDLIRDRAERIKQNPTRGSGPTIWLVNTARAELSFFGTLSSRPPYAVLSHVWDSVPETTFQDLQRLQQECAKAGTSPLDSNLVSSKMRCACDLAQSQDIEWIWLDFCCIDKCSSAELSEAINGMYDIYAGAAVCYAYLNDVPTDSPHPLDYHSSSFAQSRWHRRGWTLQELLAPELVVFVSNSWKLLGTKLEYAASLEDITGIPAPVLRSEQPLRDIPVGRRMSWASRRQTTRIEDEAYCLLGILDVNMPVVYGEGRRAFVRLQEEVMRRSPDTTLYAWGDPFRPVPGRLTTADVTEHGPDHMQDSFLLAPSPDRFKHCSDMQFISGPNPEYLPPGDPSFTHTPYGILAHIPILELRDARMTLGLLPRAYNSEKHPVALLLTRCTLGISTTHATYDIGIHLGDRPSIRTGDGPLRLVHLSPKFIASVMPAGPVLRMKGFTWETVYLRLT